MVASEPPGPDAVLAGHRLGGGANDFMSEMNPDPEDSAEDNSPTVPTIEEERHFLAQCEYVNRSITAFGRKLRRLLFERGWESEYSRVDQEEIWSKTFPDGTAQHLGEYEAYCYEEAQARGSGDRSQGEVTPRKGSAQGGENPRHFLAQCEDLNRNNVAIGTMIRKLLCQRGWEPEWSEEEQEELWSKTFPDGATACLNDNDAYGYEVNYTRRFFRDTGIAMKPRKRPKPPQSGKP